ncbi:hypothetical protein EAF04_003869 [Stromatinia cepivora]|nr:hypothetical protein EAF04_003869 [Stromatinia cepivora]
MAQQSEKGRKDVEDTPLLTTLGMCILDDLYFPDGEIKSRVLGGSGVYSILGARLFLRGKNAQRLSWLIRAGNAFPKEIEDKLQSWGTRLVIEKSEGDGVECTRGELRYFRGLNGEGGGNLEFESKTFKYVDGPYRIEPQHLSPYFDLLNSRAYHFLTSPIAALTQVPELLNMRHERGIQDIPLIIWEPLPPTGEFLELENCMNALKVVDIFSPNHIELASFFGFDKSPDPFSRSVIEDFGNKIVQRGIGKDGKGTVVIRCGPEGCCVWHRKQGKWIWMEPYWVGEEGKDIVVDATGAGNAFLGGFAVGWEKSDGDEMVGCVFGGVSAGVVCERVGVPVLDRGVESAVGNDMELWNGGDVKVRLEGYLERLVGKGIVKGFLGSYAWN